LSIVRCFNATATNYISTLSLHDALPIYYYKPSTCHLFDRFYYDKENNIRTVAVIDYKYLQSNCEELEDELVEATFNFHVTSNGRDRKSTRLNSSHVKISYAVVCLKKTIK